MIALDPLTFGLGVPAAAGALYGAVVALLALRCTRARKNPPWGRAGVPPNWVREVRLGARGERVAIEGWYARAEAARGAVILVHGRDARKGYELATDSLGLARTLVERGLSVLMIDLRGHGSSTRARMTYGVHESRDVLGALDWLLARGYRAGTIGVLGASMGGAAAIRAASADHAIGALVTDCTFADFGMLLRRNFGRVIPGGRFFLPGALAMTRAMTGVSLGRWAPARDAERLRGRPYLVVHSAGDRFVPPTHGAALAAASGGVLWLSDTRGHVGTYAALPTRYEQVIGEFFTTHLASAAWA